MPVNYFKPRPGRFGVEVGHTGFYAKGTTSLTDGGTTSFYIQPPAGHSRLAKLSVLVDTVPVDTGTLLATAKKFVAGADAATLSSALDMEALTSKVASSFSITGTEPERIFNATAVGDVLVIEVVSGTSCTTDPTELSFVAEWELLK